MFGNTPTTCFEGIDRINIIDAILHKSNEQLLLILLNWLKNQSYDVTLRSHFILKVTFF
jgi:hypothetical protein